MNDTIFQQVDEFIINLTANEDKDLLNAQANNDAHNIPQINVSPSQGKLLQLFAKICNARQILEVGTLGGYSTLWLAKALPQDGKVTTLELNETYAEIARQNFNHTGLNDKIDIRIGNARDSLKELVDANAVFDMIFIDADKPPYLEYFEWAIQLSRKGTIIIADNVIRSGKVLNKNSNDSAVLGVQRLLNTLPENTRVTSTILQTVGVKEHDGMLIAVVN